MTFNEWYGQDEIHTYNKTEHECMKMAWNAAIKAAILAWQSVDSPEATYTTAQKERKAMEALLTNSGA